MADPQKTYRIFLSAAEHSADAHCANLIASLKATDCNFEFSGIGGDKMESAGCTLIEKIVHKSAMLYNVIASIGGYIKLLLRVKKHLKITRPDIVVLCDSPALNFHIAKAAKAVNAKTLFYVAPQLWAWGRWRMDKLRRLCDRLCCILPFEKDFFAQHGIECEFVGNPLLDELKPDTEYKTKNYDGYDPSNINIALMPGSRQAEIKTLWEPMQRIALAIRKKYPNASFTTVAPDAEKQEVLKSILVPGFRCQYRINEVYQTARDCDITLIASGSATIQAAAAGCPMIVLYQSNKLMWHIAGRWLLKIKNLSLVNILAQDGIVPEFMPYFNSIEPIINTTLNLCKDKTELAAISRKLVDITSQLKTDKPAADRVAKILIDMLK
ncbi:MAG: lipid-A-disaccharide synthase [Phycisphaerae bacterium]|nr:lipid-A-disaccharide synthase [Phycisphaerae bacterium]